MKLFTALVLLAGAATAEEWMLDPAKTTVRFTLGASLHTVHGSLRLKRGHVVYDPNTGKASGEIVVDATSAVTGNDSRDRTMHQKVLESAQYPEIAFHPDRLTANEIHGTFEIHGASH